MEDTTQDEALWEAIVVQDTTQDEALWEAIVVEDITRDNAVGQDNLVLIILSISHTNPEKQLGKYFRFIFTVEFSIKYISPRSILKYSAHIEVNTVVEPPNLVTR